MKVVRSIKVYHDLQMKRKVELGEVFEVSDKRFEELRAVGVVQLVKDIKDEEKSTTNEENKVEDLTPPLKSVKKISGTEKKKKPRRRRTNKAKNS